MRSKPFWLSCAFEKGLLYRDNMSWLWSLRHWVNTLGLYGYHRWTELENHDVQRWKMDDKAHGVFLGMGVWISLKFVPSTQSKYLGLYGYHRWTELENHDGQGWTMDDKAHGVLVGMGIWISLKFVPSTPSKDLELYAYDTYIDGRSLKIMMVKDERWTIKRVGDGCMDFAQVWACSIYHNNTTKSKNSSCYI